MGYVNRYSCKYGRKPYSKWTISSTRRGDRNGNDGSGRKPYSKWTISSTVLVRYITYSH